MNQTFRLDDEEMDSFSQNGKMLIDSREEFSNSDFIDNFSLERDRRSSKRSSQKGNKPQLVKGILINCKFGNTHGTFQSKNLLSSIHKRNTIERLKESDKEPIDDMEQDQNPFIMQGQLSPVK